MYGISCLFCRREADGLGDLDTNLKTYLAEIALYNPTMMECDLLTVSQGPDGTEMSASVSISKGTVLLRIPYEQIISASVAREWTVGRALLERNPKLESRYISRLRGLFQFIREYSLVVAHGVFRSLLYTFIIGLRYGDDLDPYYSTEEQRRFKNYIRSLPATYDNPILWYTKDTGGSIGVQDSAQRIASALLSPTNLGRALPGSVQTPALTVRILLISIDTGPCVNFAEILTLLLLFSLLRRNCSLPAG